MQINLGGIIPLSTNEWKDHVSTVVFFNRCPFNCSYCHNKQMLAAKNYVDIQQVKDVIKNSIPFINSVCYSGGECTMQPEALKELLYFSKLLGLKNMVETNGYYPNIIKELYKENLVDHLFIDIKTTKEEYFNITGKVRAYERLLETLKVPIPHTKRSTIFKNIKIPKYSTFLQRGLLRLSPNKELEEYTLEEFERLIHTNRKY